MLQVGCVTSICTTCFTARAVIIAYSAFNLSAEIDVIVSHRRLPCLPESSLKLTECSLKLTECSLKLTECSLKHEMPKSTTLVQHAVLVCQFRVFVYHMHSLLGIRCTPFWVYHNRRTDPTMEPPAFVRWLNTK